MISAGVYGFTPHAGLDYVAGANRLTSQDMSAFLEAPGSLTWLKLGDRVAGFAMVKAGAAIAANQCVALHLNKDDSDVTVAAALTESTLTAAASTFTADEFHGQAAWAVIDLNGGLKQGGHYIKRNTATILYTDRTWDEALTTSSDFLVHELNSVVLADSDAVPTAHVAGVALSAITSGNYGWIQISGVHWRVRSDGSTGTNAQITGEGVRSAAAAGACRGWTNAATTAEDAHYTFGMALCSDAEVDAAAEGIPVLLTDCAKYWM